MKKAKRKQALLVCLTLSMLILAGINGNAAQNNTTMKKDTTFSQRATNTTKLDIALNGTNHVLNYREIDIPRVIKELTENVGADIVVDTTGNPSSLANVVLSCRKRGKIHIKSTLGITEINLRDLVVNEKMIFTSRCGSLKTSLKGFKEDKISVAPLITKIIKLKDFCNSIESIINNKDLIKVIIEC